MTNNTKQQIIDKVWDDKGLRPSMFEFKVDRVEEGKVTIHFLDRMSREKEVRGTFHICDMCEVIDYMNELQGADICNGCVGWEKRMKPNCADCGRKIPMTCTQRKKLGNHCSLCNAQYAVNIFNKSTDNYKYEQKR